MARRGMLKLKRTAEVVGILFEHDFFGVMRRLSQAPTTAVAGKEEPVIPPDIPPRIRALMEDLGPTFIKMGQLLATRPDLVPKPFVEEFRKFYDRTTPTPYPEVKALVEGELGKPLKEVFAGFAEEPIASASVGQVHAATLRTGEKVAVKVQHPGIEGLVSLDFEIMRPLVRFVQNLFAASRLYQPSEHLHEIEEMLRNELDYTIEARTLNRFYKNFAGASHVKVPKPYLELCTRRILVMEFIEGLPLSQATPEAMAKHGVDHRALARVLTDAMAKQIFVDRLFHADPSPGNLIITGPEQIAFIDFGAVGHVSRRRAERVMRLMHGFTTEDLDEVTQSLLELCNIHGPVDANQLRKDVERIMDTYDAGRAAVGDPVIMDLIAKTAQNNHMLLPADFFLVSRALFQFEGICARLDPEFDIVKEFTPRILAVLRSELVREEVPSIVREVGLQYAELLRTFPTRMNNLMRKLETNQFELKLRQVSPDGGARDARSRMQRSFTAVVGALIVGAGLALVSPYAQAMANFLFFGVLFVLLWAFVMLYYSD
jgi:ubiquinone biosynthesis protein